MSTTQTYGEALTLILLWIARLTALAAIATLLMILFGEWGTGPSGPRGWIYLALFPVAFSIGYLLAWRWPLFGSCMSLACMIASQIVTGRTFDWKAYSIWAILSLPGILFVIAGWRLRNENGSTTA